MKANGEEKMKEVRNQMKANREKVVNERADGEKREKQLKSSLQELETKLSLTDLELQAALKSFKDSDDRNVAHLSHIRELDDQIKKNAKMNKKTKDKDSHIEKLE